MKIKLLDIETAAKVSRVIYPEREDWDELLEYLPECLFGRELSVCVNEGSFWWCEKDDVLWAIPSYFCLVVDKLEKECEKEMRQRYLIHREYFGKFDDDVVIAVAESLTGAAFIVESLNQAFEDRPYNFDFRKVAEDIDEALDFVPGESLFEPGRVLDCFSYAEYQMKKGGFI